MYNSRDFIGLVIMVYEQLYHPRKEGVRIRTMFGGVFIIFFNLVSLLWGRFLWNNFF